MSWISDFIRGRKSEVKSEIRTDNQKMLDTLGNDINYIAHKFEYSRWNDGQIGHDIISHEIGVDLLYLDKSKHPDILDTEGKPRFNTFPLHGGPIIQEPYVVGYIVGPAMGEIYHIQSPYVLHSPSHNFRKPNGAIIQLNMSHSTRDGKTEVCEGFTLESSSGVIATFKNDAKMSQISGEPIDVGELLQALKPYANDMRERSNNLQNYYHGALDMLVEDLGKMGTASGNVGGNHARQ